MGLIGVACYSRYGSFFSKISFVVSLTISVTAGSILKVFVGGGLGASGTVVYVGSEVLRLGGRGGFAAFAFWEDAGYERLLIC